jgi:DHA2 family multidrug resistance protein
MGTPISDAAPVEKIAMPICHAPGISGILFVVRSLTFARPVVDLGALTNRNFLVGCLLSFITGVGIFSTIYLTPLFLGYVRGFSKHRS